MTRKFFAITLISLLLWQGVNAQTAQTPYTGTAAEQEKNEKPVVFRDRFILDMYHSFWMGMPTEVNHKKFDPGFNVSAIWDFKVNNKPIAFGLGVGTSYFTQYSDAVMKYNAAEDLVRYQILSEDIAYNRIKMNYLNVNIPIEFRYRNANGFKFTVGARVGLNCHLSQKYKGDDLSIPSDTVSMTNYYLPNKMKYSADVYARIGWKFINAYYSFQLTPLFTTGKGPKIYPMSVGISLSIF